MSLWKLLSTVRAQDQQLLGVGLRPDRSLCRGPCCFQTCLGVRGPHTQRFCLLSVQSCEVTGEGNHSERKRRAGEVKGDTMDKGCAKAKGFVDV